MSGFHVLGFPVQEKTSLPGRSHDKFLTKFEGAILKRSGWLNSWNERHVTIITSLLAGSPPTLQISPRISAKVFSLLFNNRVLINQAGGERSDGQESLAGARVCCTDDTIVVKTSNRTIRFRPSPEGPSRLEWMKHFAAALSWVGDRGEWNSGSIKPDAEANSSMYPSIACAQRKGVPRNRTWYCIYRGNYVESI